MIFPKWFKNPYIGLIGATASILSLAFTIYVHFKIREYRQLSYSISSERSILIDSKKASDFEIKYKGTPINTDVTSFSITLWNDGKKTIKRANILEPIEIRIGNGILILESKVIRTSRPVMNFTVDNSKKDKGIIIPSWNIMEHRDGAVIQIIYQGAFNEPVYVNGTIEGKRGIKEIYAKHSIEIGPLLSKGYVISFLVLLMIVTVTRIFFYTRKFFFSGEISKGFAHGLASLTIEFLLIMISGVIFGLILYFLYIVFPTLFFASELPVDF